MSSMTTVTMTVNGSKVTRSIEARTSLVDFLRSELSLTGTHLGCEHGVCGVCSVLMDGRVVRGCLTLAVQADGASVQTIEGVSANGDLAELQKSFHERNALQCGFCTPGMLLTAAALLESRPGASRDEIRSFMSGNYCRCTGYHAIVDAIEAVSRQKSLAPDSST